jgi:hypothetical protein
VENGSQGDGNCLLTLSREQTEKVARASVTQNEREQRTTKIRTRPLSGLNRASVPAYPRSAQSRYCFSDTEKFVVRTCTPGQVLNLISMSTSTGYVVLTEMT